MPKPLLLEHPHSSTANSSKHSRSSSSSRGVQQLELLPMLLLLEQAHSSTAKSSKRSRSSSNSRGSQQLVLLPMLLLLEQAHRSMGRCSRSNSCGLQRRLQLCTQGMLPALHQAQLSLAAQLGLARQWRQLQRRVRSPMASCWLWQLRSVTMQQQLLTCGRSSTGMLLKQTPAAAPLVTDRWLTC
jgi:hypothetical protein